MIKLQQFNKCISNTACSDLTIFLISNFQKYNFTESEGQLTTPRQINQRTGLRLSSQEMSQTTVYVEEGQLQDLAQAREMETTFRRAAYALGTV